MKTHLLRISILIALFYVGATAQKSFDGRSFAYIKKDYKLVNVVAHVEIKNINFSFRDIYPVYEVESKVIETFKGRIKKGQTFKYYWHVEDGVDVKRYIGNKRIVFLQGKYPTPHGEKGFYQLENSSLSPSKKLNTKLRQLRNVRKKG